MKLLSEIEQNDAVAETLDCFFDRSNEHRRRRVQIVRINPSSNESFTLGEFIRRRRGKLCFVFFLSSFSSSSSSVILLFLLLLLIFPLRRLRRRRRRRRRVRQRRVFCDGHHVFFSFSLSLSRFPPTEREERRDAFAKRRSARVFLCRERVLSAFCLCCFSFFFSFFSYS